jgi:hypothetical protein
MRWIKTQCREGYSGAIWENEKGDIVEQFLEGKDLGCGSVSDYSFYVIGYEAQPFTEANSNKFFSVDDGRRPQFSLQLAKKWCDENTETRLQPGKSGVNSLQLQIKNK